MICSWFMIEWVYVPLLIEITIQVLLNPGLCNRILTCCLDMVAIRNILLLFLCITVFTPILLYTYTDNLTAVNYSSGVFLIVCLLNSHF